MAFAKLKLRRYFRTFYRKLGILTVLGLLIIVGFMVFEDDVASRTHNNDPKLIVRVESSKFTAKNDEPKFPEVVDDHKFVLRNLENKVPREDVKVIKIENEDGPLENKEKAQRMFKDIGKVNVHVWDSLCSFTLNTVRQFPLFPLRPKAKTIFEVTDELKLKLDGSWLAQRIMGYLHPPVSGNYQFELSSFFMAELWLSDDVDPAKSEIISKITRNKLYDVFFSIGENSPKSRTIHLSNHSSYYFEIIHVINDVKTKEDHVRLSWKLPDFNDFTSIKKSHVSAFLVDEFQMSRNETQFKLKRSKSVVIVEEDDMSNETQHGFNMNVFRSVMSPSINFSSFNRDNVRHLSYWDRSDLRLSLYEAPYEPSYTRKRVFKRYEGVYNTHFSDVFPNDGTRLLKEGYKDPTERDGNPLIDEKEVFEVLQIFMGQLEKRYPR